MLFSNPARTEAGRVDVECDIEFQRPDETFSTQRDVTCADEFLDPARIYVSRPVLDFLGEEGDPLGEWRVRVKMKDRVRGVEVPLETSFTLQ